MNKRDKQLEKRIISALTENCEVFKSEIEGFTWLTHVVDFSNVNQIKIICVFDTNHQIKTATASNQTKAMINTITSTLSSLGINITNPNTQIRMDSEENCDLTHSGNWQKRFKQVLH